MNKLQYRVYVVENLQDGKWTPTRLRVTIFRHALRDLSDCVARNPSISQDEYRIRRVNSEEEMCRIFDLGVTASHSTHQLTGDPSQLEWIT